MSNEPPPVYEKLDERMPQSSQGFYGPDKTFFGQPGTLMRSGTWGSQQGSQQGTLRKGGNEEATIANIAGYGSESATMQNSAQQPFVLGARITNDPLGLSNSPSNPYPAPPQLPVYRDSQLSSLSSGFGDGDIVLTQPVMPQPLTAPPPVVTQALRTANDDAERYEKRETVYTQTSEDRPARFRTIDSWVNQQTGRVQRASSRAKDRGEVPVMPAIPGQLNVTQQTAYR
ncbi:hypothetical protein SLS62_009193 [Diatrype stigma]|uniref:Uncharacterized protein n=1 Tax=Diatrype stigma TaxID=117547 RepID=A0AAN9YJA2_9PEZI